VYDGTRMDVQRIDPDERLSYTIVARFGPLQLWLVPELLPSFDAPSDRTLATWVYDDGDDQLHVLRGFRSASA